MEKPLKIYLADLTYDTLQTAVFPLNVGLIASYCKKQFGSKVDITLFKYIDELDHAINESPPDILGLSNYVWNHHVGLEMFHILSQKNPHAIKIWGGPNFPMDPISQKKFLKKFSEIDIYVPIEGEIGFSNIVEKVLKTDSKEEMRKNILSNPIDSCVFLGSDDELKFTFADSRLKKLDEIPSPYTTGIMDKFFDGKLSPMLQTNRGCPFSCTFCVDGSDAVDRVNSFSLERVIGDIDYISNHVTKEMRDLEISDLNFGMYPRDQEICKHLADTKKINNFPKNVHVTTGKNQKEKIIQAIKTLSGSIRLSMSVQSMDQEVLTNIRRSNISVDKMLQLAPTIRDSGLDTTSEVILGLPGETYESHLQSLSDLLDARLDHVITYSCMVLIGSQLATPEEREKWNLETKFRILVNDFVKLSNGKNVLEIEEIIVGSNSLPFEDYLRCREINFTVYAFTSIPIFRPIQKLLLENNIDKMKLFSRVVNYAKDFPDIQKIFNQFRQLTKDELWDSPEEIEKHYQNDEEFKKLQDGKSAFNIMYYCTGQLLAESFDKWLEYIIILTRDILKENNNWNDVLDRQLIEIKNYCKGLSHNILGNNSLTDNPEFEFEYDLVKWLNDENGLRLINFKLSNSCHMSFYLTSEQFENIQNNLSIHGNVVSNWISSRKGGGFVELLQNFWRTPKIKYSSDLNEHSQEIY